MGVDREAWNRFGKKGNQHYEIIAPGYKYNMMDIQAALGLHQLKQLDGFIRRRTELTLRYHRLLKDWPQWTLTAAPAYSHLHACHLYTPLINPEVAKMERVHAGDEGARHWDGSALPCRTPIPLLPGTLRFKREIFRMPKTISDRIVSLPLSRQ